MDVGWGVLSWFDGCVDGVRLHCFDVSSISVDSWTHLQHLEKLPELEHVEGEDLLAQLCHLGGGLGGRCNTCMCICSYIGNASLAAGQVQDVDRPTGVVDPRQTPTHNHHNW